MEAGPADGPLILLLHGFPEGHLAWRHQIGPLAEAGFRVIAPDQRGYGGSDKPSGVDAYRIDVLAQDILGLADSVGHRRFRIVGHDWGGLVAWWLATHHGDRIERAAILNAPNPSAIGRYIARSFTQRLRSAYVLFFQIPALPEALLRAGNFRQLIATLRKTGKPGTFSNAVLADYRCLWSMPGALTGMLNWYRALPKRPAPLHGERVRVPTLVLWGAKDRFLEQGLADASMALCDQGRLLKLPEGTHWLQHEEPAVINRELIGFFRPA